MTRAQQSTPSEFSSLLAYPADFEHTALSHRLPSIARGGIVIRAPRIRIDNYLNLITRELALKRDYLPSRQAVYSLRLQGFPLRQFNSEELTELIFRLCSKYRILEGSQGERTACLTLEQCTSDHLALLRGLGFNHIQIAIDASIAGPDRSLDPVSRALAGIAEFAAYGIGAGVDVGADTSPIYAEKLIALLTAAGLEEIDVNLDHQGLEQAGDQDACLQLFTQICALLKGANYTLMGDKCFKKSGHPDLKLLASGNLAYGPWGFHSAATRDWLALGARAEGMIAGYLYHNLDIGEGYETSIQRGVTPVNRWSPHPVAGDEAFRFIQQLYCYHRVDQDFFSSRQPLLARLLALGWLVEESGCWTPTQDGLRNLGVMCTLFSRH